MVIVIVRFIVETSGLKVTPEIDRILKGPTVDERLKKIEEAREALKESLKVVDELKFGAEQNKRELEEALTQLTKAEKTKTETEERLKSIQTIMSNDVRAFQELAGVPDIRKERMFGFISGVIASIIASIIWWAGSEAIEKYKKYSNEVIAISNHTDKRQ